MKRLTLFILLAIVLNGCAMVREIGVYRDQKAAEEQEYKQELIDSRNSNNTDNSENTENSEYIETTPDLEDIESLEETGNSVDLENL